MKKFKTIQTLEKYFNNNIDAIMTEHDNIKGRIECILYKENILKSIHNIVLLQERFKKNLNINKLNNDNVIVFCITPHLYDLPRSYKYAKNFVCLSIVCNSKGIIYNFNRSSYRMDAPEQIIIESNFLTDLEIELLQEKL